MPIFQLKKNELIQVQEKKIDLEKDLQDITEKNLNVIFGLKFISSEFALQNFRIDSLAFDEEARSFVIIEYKRDRSFSVVDQGFSYLSLMLNNKADFLLEYNENMKSNLRRSDIDWSQSRVLFLAGSFTSYQQNAINFKDLPIELWEVKKYNNDTILYNQIKAPDTNESIKKISKNKTIVKVNREIRKYSLEDHFKEGWGDSRNLFDDIKNRILDIDPRIEEKINKYYIGYKIGAYRLCEVTVYKSKLEIGLTRVDKKDLKDPENKVTKVPWKERGWGKQCVYKLTNSTDIDYALFLVKQIYQKFYSK